MHRIIRNLLVLALVPTTIQSGMAQWSPHSGADTAHDKGLSSSHSVPKHEVHTHDRPSAANAVAPLKTGYHRRCVQPNIGCDCQDCLNYFDAHFLTLPVLVAAPPQVPKSDAYESSMIALFINLSFAPPTPPPRS